jgi:hypothetical protein
MACQHLLPFVVLPLQLQLFVLLPVLRLFYALPFLKTALLPHGHLSSFAFEIPIRREHSCYLFRPYNAMVLLHTILQGCCGPAYSTLM